VAWLCDRRPRNGGFSRLKYEHIILLHVWEYFEGANSTSYMSNVVEKTPSTTYSALIGSSMQSSSDNYLVYFQGLQKHEIVARGNRVFCYRCLATHKVTIDCRAL
jgi:hypothetical protein